VKGSGFPVLSSSKVEKSLRENDSLLFPEIRDGKSKSYPAHFCVRVPILAADGSVERNRNNKVVFEEEYGELSCWHIAH